MMSLVHLFLAPAFTMLGTVVTWLEVIAFFLAMANVTCDVREIHWAWPLALLSSLLYAWLFAASKLYGEASVNLFFAVAAIWGWWQWLRGTRHISVIHEPNINVKSSKTAYKNASKAAPVLGLRVIRLDKKGLWMACGAWLFLWGICAVVLAGITDSDVPIADGFVTSGSVVGTYLLGRKFIENWPLWLIVNAASIVLFAYKNLQLTAILYLIFFVFSIWGWRAWATKLSVDLANNKVNVMASNDTG